MSTRWRWFGPWAQLGYTLEYAKSGHLKIRHAGRYVCTASASPRNPASTRFETERILRRHYRSVA